MEKIRVGIAGYGNIGRGVELAVKQQPDMELTAVFTRREPESLELMTEGVGKYSLADAAQHRDAADVLILCGGSATDLPVQGPELAELFTTVDSFDTHPKIANYFASVDAAAKKGGNLSVISVGWDPGLFSLMRLYGASVLPEGKGYTFWGRGISQGHSDAIRRVEGVADARQYTVPIDTAMDAVRRGEQPELDARGMHKRECYVVAKEGADLAEIERRIKTMPDYFEPYDTTVHFITQEELDRDHAGMPHGGFVFRSGNTGNGTHHVLEYRIELGSNPEFTGCVLAAYARAVYRLRKEGRTGALTVFDIAPAYLSPFDGDELRRTML
ncbi:MAG: diaminopimelate dehydrogenase [Ruminococcus sp.]|nr:diaminopimelate dehydrogenase [Ruminococcus sp.]